jgi:hypothetical protein
MIGEKKRANKKGQVTIFIIIAVLVVALGVLIYMFYPKLVSKTETETTNPASFIQECMEENIQDTVDVISLQGGDYLLDENGGYFYKGKDDAEGTYVKYLCYTDEDFTPCINQKPFLMEHIELEILNSINSNMENCFNSLVASYETKGYDVNLKIGTPEIKIIPNLISTNFNRTLILTKGDEIAKYENFEINLKSNLYEMIEVTKNIIIWEINLGDSLPEAYMYNNPYLAVEKHKKENDIKVYVLTLTDENNKNSKEVFRFAVRSFASPVGFAG